MELTVPLTFGFHEDTVNGLVALKLNALSRVMLVPFRLIVVKVPTAYMVLPHCTSCRTCSVVPVYDPSCGVPLAGVEDTGPVWAAAGTAAGTASDKLARHAAALAIITFGHFPGNIKSPHLKRTKN